MTPTAPVAVAPLRAVFLYPGKLFFVLRFVVYFEVYSAQNFGHIHPFGAYAELLLHLVGVEVTAAYAHGYTAYAHIRFVAYLPHRERATCKAQYLLFHILGYAAVADILHVLAVYGKRRQASLCVRRHASSQVHRARSFRAVKAPHSLCGERV